MICLLAICVPLTEKSQSLQILLMRNVFCYKRIRTLINQRALFSLLKSSEFGALSPIVSKGIRCYSTQVGIFGTENTVRKTFGYGFWPFVMRSMAKIGYCAHKVCTVTIR